MGSACCSSPSSVFKKAIMAISGFVLIGFIIMHLAGNLFIFAGPEALNNYGQMLRNLGELLWIARGVLLLMVVLHILSAISLTLENRKARPIDYQRKKNVVTSYAARTMMMSGLIVLAYIVFHLLHFTFGVTHPDISHLTDELGRHDVYTMVVLSFREPLVSGFYVFAMALLCSHLSHGIASAFQSLGLNREDLAPKLKSLAQGLSLLIFLGYSSIPIAAFFGFLKVSEGIVL